MYLSPDAFPGKQPEPERAPPLIDNPFAPEILVTGFAGFANMGGIVQLTFESMRGNHANASPSMERVVVGRLAMPIPTAQALVTALNLFLEQRGHSPSRAAAQGAVFQ